MTAPITGISESILKENKSKWDAILNKYKPLYENQKNNKR